MATRHSGYERVPGDHYATPAWVVDALLKVEKFADPIWECAPGEGHMVRALEAHGHLIVGGDLNFLAKDNKWDAPSIVTNPPFNLAEDFCRHAIYSTLKTKGKVAMLLPVAFDTAKGRNDIFKENGIFKAKYTLTQRIRWENLEQKKAGPSNNHAWYVWDWQHRGKPTLGWLP